MRLGRWPRSLAIYIGSASYFLLHQDKFPSHDLPRFIQWAAFVFLLTWAISTANYIINEIVDAPYDVHHPTKQNRPLIRGEINRKIFIGLGAFLILSSMLAAYWLFSYAFFLSLLMLLIAGFIYNVKPIRAKDIPFFDSISESANNPIRFFIGWFAFAPANKFPPISLLLSWWSFGNFLMVAKRLSEFRFLKDKAGQYRSSLRRYSKRSLLLGMGVSAVVFFTTYFAFALGFQLQSLIYLSPFVFLYFYLFFRKTLQEKEVMEEPERLFLQPIFALYTLFLAVAFFTAILLDKINQ